MARDSHPVFARFYARASLMMERGVAGHRNFAHYPTAVSEVIAVEPEGHLRRIAQDNAAHTTVPIEVVDGLAARLPAEDQSVDVVVASPVLCTVPDLGAALAEMFRVLKSGGQLRFFEHVRADTSARRRIQRLLGATVWPALVGGCHVGRDTAEAIEQAGFVIERLNRLGFTETSMPFPICPQILGTAIRPGRPRGTR
jgi:ubiquinone/menaquinone biosynthesis C-methylase UbiE